MVTSEEPSSPCRPRRLESQLRVGTSEQLPLSPAILEGHIKHLRRLGPLRRPPLLLHTERLLVALPVCPQFRDVRQFCLGRHLPRRHYREVVNAKPPGFGEDGRERGEFRRHGVASSVKRGGTSLGSLLPSPTPRY